jgi:hypothetical protein
VRKDWRPEDDKILGTRKDRGIVLLLGRSLTNVSWRRRKFGIPAKAKSLRWTQKEDELPGSKPDKELASAFGRTVLAVAARRAESGRPKPDAAFKVVKVVAPDAGRKQPAHTANAELHRSVDAVAVKREALGIPIFAPQRIRWSKREIEMLGQRSDSIVVRMLGRTRYAVQLKRYALGIPPCWEDRRAWSREENALLGMVFF